VVGGVRGGRGVRGIEVKGVRKSYFDLMKK